MMMGHGGSMAGRWSSTRWSGMRRASDQSLSVRRYRARGSTRNQWSQGQACYWVIASCGRSHCRCSPKRGFIGIHEWRWDIEAQWRDDEGVAPGGVEWGRRLTRDGGQGGEREIEIERVTCVVGVFFCKVIVTGMILAKLLKINSQPWSKLKAQISKHIND